MVDLIDLQFPIKGIFRNCLKRLKKVTCFDRKGSSVSFFLLAVDDRYYVTIIIQNRTATISRIHRNGNLISYRIASKACTGTLVSAAIYSFFTRKTDGKYILT